jgi:hypothetical protein
MDLVVHDVLSEIKAGSIKSRDGVAVTDDTQPGAYIPRLPLSSVPSRSGTVPALGSLVKVSRAAAPFWQPPAGSPAGVYSTNGPIRATGVSTETESNNGRKMSKSRWNKPILMGATVPAEFVSPDWIPISRKGHVPDPAALTNAKPSQNPDGTLNENFIIGRYAYAIYDVGGLMDVNFAGSDASVLPAEAAARKGRLAMADLSVIPGIDSQANVNALVQWRDALSISQGATTYRDALLDPLSLDPNRSPVSDGTQSNQRFLSRQDLLRFVQDGANGNTISQDALKYLTVFTREQNAPSYRPSAPPAASMLTSLPDNIRTYFRDVRSGDFPIFPPLDETTVFDPTKYPVSAPQSAPITGVGINRNFPDSVRADGTPVAKRRFPLSRIALFADPAANAADIKKYFGLERQVAGSPAGTVNDGYTWNYTASFGPNPLPLPRFSFSASIPPTARFIKTLSEVALESPAREPNFFELLKATITNASMTRTITPVVLSAGQSIPIADFAILRLGANIIDQYDADSMPTVLATRFMSRGLAITSAHKIAGQENLPLFSEAGLWVYRPQSDPTRLTLKALMPIEVWNPNQGGASVAGTSPSKFRIILQPRAGDAFGMGGAKIRLADGGELFPSNHPIPIPANINYPGGTPESARPQIVFRNSAAFAEPKLLDSSHIIVSESIAAETFSENGAEIASGFDIFEGEVYDKRAPVSNGGADNYSFKGIFLGVQNTILPCIELQFWDGTNWQNYQGGGAWQDHQTTFLIRDNNGAIYCKDTDVASPFGSSNAANLAAFTQPQHFTNTSYSYSDPRSTFLDIPTTDSSFNRTMSPLPSSNGAGHMRGMATDATIGQSYYRPDQFSTSTGDRPAYPGRHALYFLNDKMFSFASPAANEQTYFYDPDKTLRPGDGLYGKMGSGANPFISGEVAPRPVILNRPFRSVAELGYAFRGAHPWKTVNFFTPESADAGLLDVFTLDEAEVTGGKVNLNTPHKEILEAILRGSLLVEDFGTSISATEKMSNSDAASLAQAIVDETRAATASPFPMVNKADLVRRVMARPEFKAFANNLKIKTQIESFARALGEVGQTRTWNLMIDLVVQAGRCTDSSDLAKFTVEGERRYWLHLAIDRYTGKIVDQKLESVYE